MISRKIEIIYGDITKVSCDAIVNSANPSLLAGGGVDGAIHKAAGGELEEECQYLNGCKVGESKITKSYGLSMYNIWWIIHAVGPRWFGGIQNEPMLLKSAYQSSLQAAISYADIYKSQMLPIVERYFEGKELKEEIRALDKYILDHPIRSIAFPSISTGIYHYPLDEAVKIALDTIDTFADKDFNLEKIMFVCKDQRAYEAFLKYHSNK